MKSIVLMIFIMMPNGGKKLGQFEYFESFDTCEARIVEIKATHPNAANMLLKCHKTVPEVPAEGNDAV